MCDGEKKMVRERWFEFSSCKQKEDPLQDALQADSVANTHTHTHNDGKKLKYETVAAHISSVRTVKDREPTLIHTLTCTPNSVCVCVCVCVHVFVLSSCPLGT